MGFVLRSLSPSVCQKGRGIQKLVTFPFEGTIFQKLVTNFWTNFFDDFLLGISTVSCTSGHKKKILHKIRHRICEELGCLKRGVLSTAHGSEAGTHQCLIKQLAQSLASNGEVSNLDGLCPLSLQTDGSNCQGNTAGGSLCGGPKNFIEFLRHGTQLQLKTNVFLGLLRSLS